MIFKRKYCNWPFSIETCWELPSAIGRKRDDTIRLLRSLNSKHNPKLGEHLGCRHVFHVLRGNKVMAKQVNWADYKPSSSFVIFTIGFEGRSLAFGGAGWLNGGRGGGGIFKGIWRAKKYCWYWSETKLTNSNCYRTWGESVTCSVASLFELEVESSPKIIGLMSWLDWMTVFALETSSSEVKSMTPPCFGGEMFFGWMTTGVPVKGKAGPLFVGDVTDWFNIKLLLWIWNQIK